MKSGLVSLLTGESTVNAIVGSRVYISNAPQKATFPHIVITQMGSNENGALDGNSGNLRMIDYQIDCRAKTSVGAESLGNAVRTFIDDYSGAAGSYTIGAVLMNSEVDDFEPPTDGSETGTYVVSLDLTIHFNP